MTRMILFSILMGVALSAPAPQGTTESDDFWGDSSLDWGVLGEYERYVPKTVKKLINETMGLGQDAVYKLYQDVQSEVLDKTQDNIKDFDAFYNEMLKDVEEMYKTQEEIFLSSDSRSEEEVEQTRVELIETKEKLKQLAEEVKEEMKKQEQPGNGSEGQQSDLHKALQNFLTYCRSIIANEVLVQQDWVFNKVRQFEGHSYNFLDTVAERTKELKTLVSDLFDKFGTIDLKRVVDGDENESSAEDVPRSN